MWNGGKPAAGQVPGSSGATSNDRSIIRGAPDLSDAAALPDGADCAPPDSAAGTARGAKASIMPNQQLAIAVHPPSVKRDAWVVKFHLRYGSRLRARGRFIVDRYRTWPNPA